MTDWSCLTGHVVFPGNPTYDNDRTEYNTRATRSPGAIVFCQSVEDVQNAVRCVRGNSIPFRVRSGRHSYEEFSVMDAGLVIDISALTGKTIAVAPDGSATARVQAGLSQQDMWLFLGGTPYAFPLGTMASVGIAGVLQGGGIGMMTRAVGLALDRVSGIQVVTAAGDLVEANAAANTDLYWALRGGGGGNFGIVTAFTLDLVPLGDVAIYAMQWPAEQYAAVMAFWQQWAPALTDTRLTCQLTFSSEASSSSGPLHSEGLFLGTADELAALLQPWMSSPCPPVTPPSIQTMSWFNSTGYFNSFDNQYSHPFKTNGAFVYDPLPPEALNIIERAITTAPADISVDIWTQSFGGAMAAVAPDATAFFHRKAQFILEFGATWTDPANRTAAADALRWASALRTALAPYTHGTYVNFVDLGLGSVSTQDFTYLGMYYGGNVPALRGIKTERDASNLFRFEQSVPPLQDPPH